MEILELPDELLYAQAIPPHGMNEAPGVSRAQSEW